MLSCKMKSCLFVCVYYVFVQVEKEGHPPSLTNNNTTFNKKKAAKLAFCMETRGFEPLTFPMQRERSTTDLRPQKNKHYARAP